MEKRNLNLDDLSVETFVTEPSFALATTDPVLAEPIADPFCCTGCTTGCGINPTAGGCESGGGGTIAY